MEINKNVPPPPCKTNKEKRRSRDVQHCISNTWKEITAQMRPTRSQLHLFIQCRRPIDTSEFTCNGKLTARHMGYNYYFQCAQEKFYERLTNSMVKWHMVIIRWWLSGGYYQALKGRLLYGELNCTRSDLVWPWKIQLKVWTFEASDLVKEQI